MDHVSTTSPSSIPHDSCQLRRPSRGPSFYPPRSPPSSSPPQVRSAKPFSLQNRRLQLRNAGFRAAQLPGRKISDHLATFRSLSGGSERETDKENSPGSSTHDCSSRDGGSSRRRVNVLQEINNSTTRRRYSPRPSVTTLFQDPPPEHSPEPLFSSPPTKRVGKLGPPISFDGADDSDIDSAMKTRDQSLAGSSPLLHSSPISRRKKNDQRRHPASYETTRYIEHLEAQLSASQTELDSRQTSPIKPQITRLRSLNAEIRMLKQEISDWRSKFEARVREEIGSRSETECKLKAKIGALEEKIEADHRRMKELEYENEMQAQRLRNAEALSSTNRSLERRVDVLTELLAQSPTRNDPGRSPTRGFDAVSPVRDGKLRPRSMMPCIPCSPRAGNEGFFQPLAFPGPKTSNDPNDVPYLSVEIAESRSASDEQSIFDRNKSSARPESMLTDSLSAESTWLHSTSRSSMYKSQRSSMLSQYSSMSGWSLPFPFSPDGQGKTSSRHRSMRRFPSGSCTLKPLILPSATATMSDHPASAPYHSVSYPPQESQSSFDPTTAFLDDQMYDMSSGINRNTSPWAEQDSLDALEGRTCYYESFEEAISRHRRAMSSDMSPTPHKGLDMHSDGGLSSRPLQETIVEENDQPALEYSLRPPNPGIERQLFSTRERDSRSPNLFAHGLGNDFARTPSKSYTKRHRKQRSDKNRTPKPKQIDARSAICSPVAGVTSEHAVGILFRYSSWLKEVQRYPTELARTIIANAWHSNWRRLGKLSWWVLGLFLGPQIRGSWFTSRSTAEPDNYDWHRYSMGAVHLKQAPSLENHQPVTDPVLLSETSNRLSGLAWCEISRTQNGQPEPPKDSCSKVSSTSQSSFGRSLCLWAKFSFALVLAIGLAVKNGPGTLFEEPSHNQPATNLHDRHYPRNKNSSPQSRNPKPCHSGANDDDDVCHSEMSGLTAFAEDDPPQTLVRRPSLTADIFFRS